MSKTNVTRVCESSSSNLVFRCFFVDESNVSFLHLCSFRAANTTKGFHRSTGKLAPLSPTGATTSIYSPRAESCPGLSIHRRRNLRSVNAQLFLIVASTLSDSVSPQTQFKSVGNAAVGKQSVGELRAWETEHCLHVSLLAGGYRAASC